MEEQSVGEKPKQGKVVKILSIDGGGIRGVIPAMVLQRIEQMTGKPIARLFDLIAGTSTGGVISLLLTKPKPESKTEPMYTATEIVNLYIEHGKDMFWRSFWYKLITLNGWIGPKYPERSVLSTLQSYLDRDERAELKDALTDVLLTSYDIEQRSSFYFRRCDAREKPFLNFYMSDAARGTAAAPTFFPTIEIKSVDGSMTYHLIDGGLVANNPTTLAVAEAISQHGPYIYPIVVSLGTGSYQEPIRYSKARRWGLIGWAPSILDVMFDGVSSGVEEGAKQIIPAMSNGYYYRFQLPLTKGDDAMDNYDPENIQILRALAFKMIEIYEPVIEQVAKLLLQSESKPQPGA